VAALQLRRHHTLDWIAKKLKKKVTAKKEKHERKTGFGKAKHRILCKKYAYLISRKDFVIAWGAVVKIMWYG